MGEVDPNLRCHGNMMRYQLVFIFILFFIYTHTHTHTHKIPTSWSTWFLANESLDYDLSCILHAIIGL